MNKPVTYSILFSALILLPTLLQATDLYEQIKHDDQDISIQYQTGINDNEQKIIHLWLQQIVDALLTVYGELPKNHFQINIERSTNQVSPVPWGHVERGKPTIVFLVMNPALGYDNLINDWTAFHEMSHLLLPYRGYGNIWLSEGLATYYQNIIQTRAGLFQETKMWRKIMAGFKRGSKDQRWRDTNLTVTSNNLRESRQYMRVHWSGVLFWLTADVELRKQGKGTLDGALKKLKYCCEKMSMSASSIVHKLDELSNVHLFVPLFKEYSESHSIPKYSSILADLGVTQISMKEGIFINNNAPHAEIRRRLIVRY
jgi:hypothetical protein